MRGAAGKESQALASKREQVAGEDGIRSIVLGVRINASHDYQVKLFSVEFVLNIPFVA